MRSDRNAASDVPVQVVTRNLFRKAVRIAADACAFAVCGGSQAAQTVVGKLITSYRAFVACLPSHAADVAVIAERTGTVRIMD